MLQLGVHCSISGGHHKALSQAALLGCQSLQLFTKNQQQWKSKPLVEEEVSLFISERARLGVATILAHDSYLINLGSPDKILWNKSVDAFIDEMHRAEHLEIEYLVFHPGSHLGSGEENGIDQIASALNRAIESLNVFELTLLIETTAGQGTSIGWRFEHLRGIIDRVERRECLGICFDTAHVFTAGYELRTEEGYKSTMHEFDQVIGLEKLKAFHLNDSKKDIATHVDRHEHIGRGFLGEKPFEYILSDERFDGLAGCLETPKEGDWDKKNLITLRRLLKMPCAKKATPGCGSMKVTAKAAPKTIAKKATPKKATAKATAKKVTAKKVVKKAPVKKVAAKKPAAKKPAAKKVAAKKPVAKKK